MVESFRRLYSAPHVRVVPYLAGMLWGFISHWIKSHPLKLVRFSWIILVGFLVMPIVISPGVSVPVYGCALLYSLGKYVYGITVGALITYSIFSPPDSVAKRFLSNGVIVHLNKLSYGMYVIHPIAIFIVFGLQSQPLVIDNLLWVSC